MGGEPLLDFLGVGNLGIIGDDGEVREERRRVRAIERLQQVEEEPGLLGYHTQWGIVPVVKSRAPAR